MPDLTAQRLLIVFLIPVGLGIVLLWQTRRDRRQQFIQSRLDAFAASVRPDVQPMSLRRLQKTATLLRLPGTLRTLLDAAFESTGRRVGFVHLLFVSLIAVILVHLFTTYILILNPMLRMLGCGFGALVSPIALLRGARANYQRKFLDAFCDVLDLIGRAVKAGLPVTEALLVAGNEASDPVGRELRRAFEQVQIGTPLIDALEQTADRIQVADFRFMVVALTLQQKTGGSLAETLKNLSSVIRARKALRLKARALSAEAKVSAFILAILPFAVSGMMYLLNPDLMRVLVVDPRGRFMVGVAFLSLVIGLVTMRVMVKRAVR